MFAFMAIAIVLAFASCNSKTKVTTPVENNFTYTCTMDTCITVKVPVTAPIGLCSGGKSIYRKVKSYKDSVICLSKGQTITLSSDEMNSKGWYYFPIGTTPVMPDNSDSDNSGINQSSSSHSGFNWMPNWLSDIFQVLWPLALLAFILWLGYLLFMAMRNNTPAATGAGRRRNDPPAGEEGSERWVANPVQPVSVENNASATAEANTTVVMPENFGQKPMFVIKNTGAGSITVGNIHIGKGDQLVDLDLNEESPK